MVTVGRVTVAGSSPLTRGKRGRGRRGLVAGRLIPAHAGKTATLRQWNASLAAHPRSRGENPTSNTLSAQRRGSSPLTRGKLGHTPSLNCPDRLIPAHAGKTVGFVFCKACHRAHPRSRGENSFYPPVKRPPCGSSPLTRGKLQPSRVRSYASGLIPAHAGKTR